MKSFKKIASFAIVFCLMFAPFFFVSAASYLRPDCGHAGEKVCDFNSLITLINNAITFFLFTIATPMVVLILLYAGFMLVTSGGNAESLSKAKTIIKHVVFGYVAALVAWLVITQILKIFGFTDTSLVNY